MKTAEGWYPAYQNKMILWTPSTRVKNNKPTEPAAHMFANDRLHFQNSLLLFRKERHIRKETHIFTWQEFGRGKNPFLNMSNFTEEFFCCHGKIQSVPDYLTSIQRIPAHHGRLHGPCVLLFKAVTYFLESHGVQPLRV